MPTLYLEWGGDLQISPSGGLMMAYGWDEVRQRIERRVLTTAQGMTADGLPVQADYIFHPDYGLSFRILIGEPRTQALIEKIKAGIYEGCMIDEGVDVTQPPSISVNSKDPLGKVYITANIRLKTGKPGALIFQVV